MGSHSPSVFADLREQVVHECAAMARYALASGMTVPPQLIATIEKVRATPAGQPLDLAAVARAHDQLSKLVAPATPRALLLLGDDDHASMSKIAWLGHVGIARRMMLVAAIAVLAFLAISVSDLVDDPRATLLSANGWGAVALEIWWVSAAAMGASFAMLMQVSDYIVKRTYDPKYEPTYWIKFLLGIIAGVILAALVPMGQTNGPVAQMGHPTLAMLGGFSASAVYRILTRLVDSVESVFRPSSKEEVAMSQREAQNRTTQETGQAKLALAGQIVKLQQQVAGGAANADVSQSLQAILDTLVPGDGTSTPEPPAGTVALPGISVVAAPAAEAGDGDASPAPAQTAPAASTDEPEPAETAPAAAADAPADEPAAQTTAASEPAAG